MTIASEKLHRSMHMLVAANRILAHEGVVDAYGHVSIRHPFARDQFLISRSLSPELVTAQDLFAFFLDGQAVRDDTPPPYLERYIHGSIYKKRPEIQAVIHSHADDVLPFTIASETPLTPVINTASDIGSDLPIWDIQDQFGDTNLLVTTPEQGDDLANTLGNNKVVLMRGHGFTAAATSLVGAVKAAVYMPKNAKILMNALRLGPVKSLSRGEIEIRSKVDPQSAQMWRAWEYWCYKAGVEPGLREDL
jgi:HCOMODA/2-hydroxy-3-carboxy-muconic semialdehyde decarboxylase